jgi:tRNA nucleotidyltransferase (CCA-adding enzyme)
MNLPATEIRSWAACVKMPNEVRDFSEIFSELCSLVENTANEKNGAFQPADVLAWFNRADVWRKPDRSQALLGLAKRIGLNVDTVILAMQSAQALNTAEIIEGIPVAERSSGERIRSAVDTARLSAITAAFTS